MASMKLSDPDGSYGIAGSMKWMGSAGGVPTGNDAVARSPSASHPLGDRSDSLCSLESLDSESSSIGADQALPRSPSTQENAAKNDPEPSKGPGSGGRMDLFSRTKTKWFGRRGEAVPQERAHIDCEQAARFVEEEVKVKEIQSSVGEMLLEEDDLGI